MFRIESKVDTKSPDYLRNVEAMERILAEYRERLAKAREGGPPKSRKLHTSRGKLLVRDRLDRLFDPNTPSSSSARWRPTGCTTTRPRRPAWSPGRRRPRPRSPGRGQRRHGQGRDLFPDDHQEAPPRPGGGPREPAALHLSRRLGRHLPAPPVGDLPRQGALRPHLLQPGPPLGPGHSPDLDRHGLVHGRRGLRPGHERRDGHRPPPGDDLHRRSAAGQGGHRRGGLGRGPRRGRRPLPHLRRLGLLRL
jgi:hypothetical protein